MTQQAEKQQNGNAMTNVDNRSCEFVPFGGDEKISLSIGMIRRYLTTPTRSGKVASDEQIVKFMMLCKSRKLNPFEGDAFLLGYDKKDGSAEFSLITAHQAFLKRAELHPEYDGMESGVMVQAAEGDIIDRVGDFCFDDDKLLGGWAVVHFKTRKICMRRRAKLATYRKPFGVWLNDPAGMIVKVVESDALRSSFPTVLGGMFLAPDENMTTQTPAITQFIPNITTGTGQPARIETPKKPQRHTVPAQQVVDDAGEIEPGYLDDVPDADQVGEIPPVQAADLTPAQKIADLFGERLAKCLTLADVLNIETEADNAKKAGEIGQDERDRIRDMAHVKKQELAKKGKR